MKEKGSEIANAEKSVIKYGLKLEGLLSSSDLEQEAQDVWQKERSATDLFTTISSWEEAGKCTMEDVCVILGWLLLDKEDTDWRKVVKCFSLEQQAQIKIPKWVQRGEGSPEYDDIDEYSVSSGGSCGNDKKNRGW